MYILLSKVALSARLHACWPMGTKYSCARLMVCIACAIYTILARSDAAATIYFIMQLCVASIRAVFIAERISARLWMRDLFSQCTCVRAYVRTYVSVTLRNVNLRYCLGMSIWGHAQAGYQIPRALHNDVGTTFLATEDGRTARLGLRNVRIWLSQVQKRVLNAADG